MSTIMTGFRERAERVERAERAGEAEAGADVAERGRRPRRARRAPVTSSSARADSIVRTSVPAEEEPDVDDAEGEDRPERPLVDDAPVEPDRERRPRGGRSGRARAAGAWRSRMMPHDLDRSRRSTRRSRRSASRRRASATSAPSSSRSWRCRSRSSSSSRRSGRPTDGRPSRPPSRYPPGAARGRGSATAARRITR